MKSRQQLVQKAKRSWIHVTTTAVKVFDSPTTQKMILTFSWITLIASTIYLSILASLSHLSTGDQYDSAYPVGSWHPGASISFYAQHTNLIKIPYLWIQAKLFVFGTPGYVAMNTFLVVLTVVAWSLIVYKLIKNTTARSAANFILAGTLLSSYEFSTSLVMPTIRNIEYPLLLVYLLLLQSFIQAPKRAKWIYAWIILTLLVASDYLFLFIVPLSIFAVLLILYWRRAIKKAAALTVAANALSSAIGGLLLLKIGELIGILHLVPNPTPSTVIAYGEFWGQVQNCIIQVLRIFGGDFFGLPTRAIAATRLILACVAIMSVVAAYVVLRYRVTVSHLKQNQIFTYYSIAFLFFAVIAAYIFSGYATPAEENIRYISALPFLGILLLVILFQFSSRVLLLISLVILLSGIHTLPLTKNTYAYERQQSDAWVNLDKNIISYLKSQHVAVGYGTLGYSSTTWFFSRQTINIYNIQPCNIKNPVLSTSAWYTSHDVTKSALIVDKSVGAVWTDESWAPCSQQTLQSIYGSPIAQKVVGTQQGKPIEVLVYDYDIVSRLKD